MRRDRPALPGQLRRIAILLDAFGLPDRERAIGYCSAIAGRPLTTRKELTVLEASRILDELERRVATLSRGAA